jgi:hypothetical protein
MKLPSIDFVHVAGVRRAVVPEGDIREDVAFQNDINILLARLDAKNPPLTALGWIREPLANPPVAVASIGVAGRALRIIKRGGRDLALNNIATDSSPQFARIARSS